MNAYTVVGPTNVQPRRLRSFDIAVDSTVSAGISVGASPNVACGQT